LSNRRTAREMISGVASKPCARDLTAQHRSLLAQEVQDGLVNRLVEGQFAGRVPLRIRRIVGQRQRHVAAQPAFGRHRRGNDLAGAGQVVVAHPQREIDDFLGQERHIVEDLEDVAQAGRGLVVEERVVVRDEAGNLAWADLHHHARAAGRLDAVGQAVGQQTEPGHGHGHADQAHQRPSPRRRDRTSFMSSHVSRFLSGLRRR
jgi:hypothetical protein